MSVEVEFVTLGDVSKMLDVPAPTLRHWTQQLEENGVHFVKRNNRNERIYYDSDIEILTFLRDLKSEHGRRTTTKDLSYIIAEKGLKGEFELRTIEDAPIPKPSSKTVDLLNQEDIQQLMNSERVRQFMKVVVDETTKNIKDQLISEVKEEVKIEVKEELQKQNDKMEEMVRRMEESVKKRDEQTLQFFDEIKQKREEEKKKGFFARLFGK